MPGRCTARRSFTSPWDCSSLLGVGFALDRAKVRYAHGPYLAGYVLAGFALARALEWREALETWK